MCNQLNYKNFRKRPRPCSGEHSVLPGRELAVRRRAGLPRVAAGNLGGDALEKACGTEGQDGFTLEGAG